MTLLDATAVYMDVIRDMAVLDLQINNEKVLKKHLESYRKRFKAGELTRTDVAQSEARVSGGIYQNTIRLSIGTAKIFLKKIPVKQFFFS